MHLRRCLLVLLLAIHGVAQAQGREELPTRVAEYEEEPAPTDPSIFEEPPVDPPPPDEAIGGDDPYQPQEPQIDFGTPE